MAQQEEARRQIPDLSFLSFSNVLFVPPIGQAWTEPEGEGKAFCTGQGREVESSGGLTLIHSI